MLVAERWPQIESKMATVAVLSFRDALRLVAAPKSEPPQDSENPPQEHHLRVDQDLLAAIPELSPDRQLIALDPNDKSYLVEVHPSVVHPGYYHLLVYRDLDTDNAEVIYDGRPARYDQRLLAHALEHVHGVMPTYWDTKPATGETPWPVEANKTSKPGRVHAARKTA